MAIAPLLLLPPSPTPLADPYMHTVVPRTRWSHTRIPTTRTSPAITRRAPAAPKPYQPWHRALLLPPPPPQDDGSVVVNVAKGTTGMSVRFEGGEPQQLVTVDMLQAMEDRLLAAAAATSEELGKQLVRPLALLARPQPARLIHVCRTTQCPRVTVVQSPCTRWWAGRARGRQG